MAGNLMGPFARYSTVRGLGSCRFRTLASYFYSNDQEEQDAIGGLIASFKEHHPGVNTWEDLQAVVDDIEDNILEPIPDKIATTMHADECMLVRPELIEKLGEWRDAAWEEHKKLFPRPWGVPAGKKPVIYLTSGYRRLGTTVRPGVPADDLYGVRDASDAFGHWNGCAVDVVTRSGAKTLFANRFDPPMDPAVLNSIGQNDVEGFFHLAGDPPHWYVRVPYTGP
jgi:hypothetical protein